MHTLIGITGWFSRRTQAMPSSVGLGVILALALGTSAQTRAAETAQAFTTPDEAIASFAAATRLKDQQALRSIFGPALEDLANPDRVQAGHELEAFSTAFDEAHRLVRESDTRYVLEIGADRWPFPIPLVERAGSWYFDAAAGKEELLNRRIGQNELAVLKVLRAYVGAQREYASRDRDGDDVLEFAQRLASTPGRKDGLYWSLDLDGEMSPLGPLVAHAHGEGYRRDPNSDSSAPLPFHGYLFRILTRQGRNAPGGRYDYVINGNMIGGFAMVAWPAEYGTSGIMTFIVNQQGRVYQRDLGASRTQSAARRKAYDPDPNWQACPD